MSTVKSPSLIALITKQLRVFIVLLLVFSFGVGTTMIQVIGWATMIPTQLAQTGSLNQAVENTFSGEHPCPMCKLAEAKQKAEQKPTPHTPENTKSENKLTACISIPVLPVKIFPPAPSHFIHPEVMLLLLSHSSRPACPPPDSFVVIL